MGSVVFFMETVFLIKLTTTMSGHKVIRVKYLTLGVVKLVEFSLHRILVQRVASSHYDENILFQLVVTICASRMLLVIFAIRSCDTTRYLHT